MKSDQKTEDNLEYFDDRPICQAMKKAQEEGRFLLMEELQEAFEKAKENPQAVAGFPSRKQPTNLPSKPLKTQI